MGSLHRVAFDQAVCSGFSANEVATIMYLREYRDRPLFVFTMHSFLRDGGAARENEMNEYIACFATSGSGLKDGHECRCGNSSRLDTYPRVFMFSLVATGHSANCVCVCVCVCSLALPLFCTSRHQLQIDQACPSLSKVELCQT